MRFSPLVERIAGSGAGAWTVHIQAARRRDAGEEIIFLTVGDPDQVAMLPCDAFGPSAAGLLRIVLTVPETLLAEAGRRIARFADTLARRRG